MWTVYINRDDLNAKKHESKVLVLTLFIACSIPFLFLWLFLKIMDAPILP